MVRFISSVFFRYWEAISLSPALHGVGVTRLRPGAELNPAQAGNVAPNLPRTPALQSGEEVRVIHFTYGEKIPPERKREFEEKVLPRLGELSEIGKCAASVVVENPDYLENLNGRVVLEKCYEEAGLEKPEWLNLEYNSENVDIGTIILEEFAERFKKYINDLYSRYVSRIVYTDSETLRATVVTPDQATLQEKLRVLLEKHMLPEVRAARDKIIITGVLLSELGTENKVSLKSLAEILGCEYKNVKLQGRVLRGAEISVEKLVELLTS